MRKLLLGVLFALLAVPAYAVDLVQTDEGSAVWRPNLSSPGIFRDSNGVRVITDFPIGPSVVALTVSDISASVTYFAVAPRAGRLIEAFFVNDTQSAAQANGTLFTLSIGGPDVNTTGTFTPVTSTATHSVVQAVTTAAGGVGWLDLRRHRVDQLGLATEVSHGWPISASSGGEGADGGGVLYIILE